MLIYLSKGYSGFAKGADSLRCRSVSEVVTGSFDVDFINNVQDLGRLRFHAHCWDSLSGIKTVWLNVGTFPYGDDVHSEDVGALHLITLILPSLNLHPGVQYFLTISAEDAAGWITRKTSDGFTIDLVCANCLCFFFCDVDVCCPYSD